MEKKASKTEQMLEWAERAMPEIRRQIAVYEKSLKSGTQIKSPKAAP